MARVLMADCAFCQGDGTKSKADRALPFCPAPPKGGEGQNGKACKLATCFRVCLASRFHTLWCFGFARSFWSSWWKKRILGWELVIPSFNLTFILLSRLSLIFLLHSSIFTKPFSFSSSKRLPPFTSDSWQDAEKWHWREQKYVEDKQMWNRAVFNTLAQCHILRHFDPNRIENRHGNCGFWRATQSGATIPCWRFVS